MAKRKRSRTASKSSGNPFAFLGSKNFWLFVVGIATAALLFFGARQAADALFDSKFFKIKTVEIDSALSFMDKRDLEILNGKSIFAVDVSRLQRSLMGKYPQMAQVTIVKKFPNRIMVLAKKRAPFALLYAQSKTFLVDQQGVVLNGFPQKDEKFPLVSGITHSGRIATGTLLRSEDMMFALNIIKTFQQNPSLAPYTVKKIDMDNLKEINVHLTNGLKIIVDKNDIGRKMDMLAFVLARNNTNDGQIKYIDLRFKDPILGTK